MYLPCRNVFKITEKVLDNENYFTFKKVLNPRPIENFGTPLSQLV